VTGAILKDSPALLSARQPLTPPALDHVVGRCLEKDPEDRWQTAADLRRELQWVATSQTPTIAPSAPTTRPRGMLALMVAAGLMAFAAGAGFAWRYLTPASPAAQVVQFDVLPPIDAMLSPAPVASAPQLALSPDGRQLAFVAQKRHGVSQIYLRSIDGHDVRALSDTDGASFPFWSPDNRYIAFFAGRELKKITVGGGASEVLCDAPNGRGGTWNADGVILFSPTPNAGLSQVPSAGGQLSEVTSINRADQTDERVIGMNWAQFLPDGRHFLYYQRAAEPQHQGVYVGELGTANRSARVLAINGLAVHASGHLAFVRDGVLLAQAFDLRTFQTTGEAIRIADHVGYFSGSFGYSSITASPAGLLAYGGPVWHDDKPPVAWPRRQAR
jgi:eukaryotic-like serine/threonine-protein kinase